MNTKDLVAQRKACRRELIAKRLDLPVTVRSASQSTITAHLGELKTALVGFVVGFYWPHQGEMDLRNLMQSWVADGIVVALPTLTQRHGTMQFGRWANNVRMIEGAYGIPIPDGTEILVPDVVLLPMVGYDKHGYCLNYGGNYFDQLIKTTVRPPVAIGIAIAESQMETIYPLPDEAPMDCIVTEHGFCAVESTGLEALDMASARTRLQGLLERRRLPRLQSNQICDPAMQLSSPVCYAGEFPSYFESSE